jgi:hypothetical protein
MAQITFTIPDTKIQHFIDCFGEDYDAKVEAEEIDDQAISKNDYAKDQAFQYLAKRVKDWKYNQDQQAITLIDITQE